MARSLQFELLSSDQGACKIDTKHSSFASLSMGMMLENTNHVAPVHHALRKGAAMLHKHLQPVEAQASGVFDHFGASEARESGSICATKPSQAWFPRLAAQVGGMLQPQGDTHNDNDPTQRVMNVLTSLPFLAVGLHSLKHRKTTEGRNHALSLLAVGTVATAYHASSGESRKVWRKLDYWTIGLSSALMGKALWPERTWTRRALNASMLAIPFKPFLVSTVHILAMQTEFLRQAAQHKSVRKHLGWHLAAAGAGAVAFAVEDPLAEAGFPHVHSIWHLLAAGGVATMVGLVAHKEKLRFNKDLPAYRPVLRGCHDSANSLQSLEREWRRAKGKGEV